MADSVFHLSSPSTEKPLRLEVCLPANRDAIQRILDRPEVQAVQLNKERPVCVGVRRGGKYSWWFGADFHAALEAVTAGLVERRKPDVETEL